MSFEISSIALNAPSVSVGDDIVITVSLKMLNALYDINNARILDKNGAALLFDSGFKYSSSFSADIINSFCSEVLS